MQYLILNFTIFFLQCISKKQKLSTKKNNSKDYKSWRERDFRKTILYKKLSEKQK